jgi:hypothetical protein
VTDKLQDEHTCSFFPEDLLVTIISLKAHVCQGCLASSSIASENDEQPAQCSVPLFWQPGQNHLHGFLTRTALSARGTGKAGLPP